MNKLAEILKIIAAVIIMDLMTSIRVIVLFTGIIIYKIIYISGRILKVLSPDFGVRACGEYMSDIKDYPKFLALSFWVCVDMIRNCGDFISG